MRRKADARHRLLRVLVVDHDAEARRGDLAELDAL
jgi:hypothetical protein